MKTKLFLLIMILFAGLSCQEKHANTEEINSPIEGAWKLIYGSTMLGDSLLSADDYTKNKEESQIKIWTESHFLFSGRFKSDTSFRINAGGGTYVLDGSNYEENLLYHTSPLYQGKILKLNIEIRNDTLFQTWYMEYEGNKYLLEERYARLE